MHEFWGTFLIQIIAQYPSQRKQYGRKNTYMPLRSETDLTSGLSAARSFPTWYRSLRSQPVTDWRGIQLMSLIEPHRAWLRQTCTVPCLWRSICVLWLRKQVALPVKASGECPVSLIVLSLQVRAVSFLSLKKNFGALGHMIVITFIIQNLHCEGTITQIVKARLQNSKLTDSCSKLNLK